jgi:hypothetical protein
MPATSVNPRLIRLAILAVLAVIALCVAMCGLSHSTSNNTNNAKPTVSATPPRSAPSAAPPPAPPPPVVAKDYVEGLVESVSGNTIALRTRTGSATVDFTPSTQVFEVTPAQLTDVSPGSCINVRATPQSAPAGAAITAQSVTITRTIDGKCPPPLASTPPSPPSQVTPSPSTRSVPAVKPRRPMSPSPTRPPTANSQLPTIKRSRMVGAWGLREPIATARCKRRSSVSKRAHLLGAHTTTFTSPTPTSTSKGL